MNIVVDPHGAGHPRGDASPGISNPVDVGDERTAVKQGEVSGTELTVRPEGPGCDAMEARPHLVEQSQSAAALPEPIHQRRKDLFVVTRCDGSSRFETVDAIGKARHLHKHQFS